MGGKPLKKTKRKQAKTRTRTVARIPPSSPDARDEGPRLLPYDKSEPSPHGHFTELADIALGRKKQP